MCVFYKHFPSHTKYNYTTKMRSCTLCDAKYGSLYKNAYCFLLQRTMPCKANHSYYSLSSRFTQIWSSSSCFTSTSAGHCDISSLAF